MPDCSECPLVEWLQQKRRNAQTTVAACEADLAEGALAVERQGLVIALARARHTEDLCTNALAQIPNIPDGGHPCRR